MIGEDQGTVETHAKAPKPPEAGGAEGPVSGKAS